MSGRAAARAVGLVAWLASASAVASPPPASAVASPPPASAVASPPPASAVASSPLASAVASSPLAIVVGNDVGRPDEPVLRYAESDAARIADILVTLGAFSESGTRLLQGRSAAEVRAAILDAEATLARGGPDGMLLIYYSGHADAEALHLGGTTFPLSELQELLGRVGVATRVMVVDACRSGTLTQTKGGRAAGAFDVRLAPAENPHGLAIVTSSASGEAAQESDELRASFFTHHFAAALLGAADRDGDGAVTLGEAFAYAARNTLASTALTRVGPQHPTFKLDMGGREDLVLTRPRGAASFGQLALVEPGWYLVRRQGDAGVVAEIDNDGTTRPLALPAGRYEVTRRSDDRVATGSFDVVAAGDTVVTQARLRPVEFGRVVRKGGTTRTRATAVFASAGLRGPVLDLGAGWGGGLGARVDLRAVTVTAALDLVDSARESVRGTSLDTREIDLRLGTLRAFDLRVATLAAGVELGLGRFTQTASDQPLPGASYAGSVGPTAVAEVPLSRRLFLWLQAGVPVYLVRALDPTRAAAGREWHATYRGTAAVGGYL